MTTQTEETNSMENFIEPDAAKNQTWENNHALITRAITTAIRQNERIPTAVEIAEQTGLSRQTVYKHLKEFGNSAFIGDQMDQLNVMSSRVLAKVVELAMDGDIRAAKLSLEIMGIIKSKNNPNKINVPGKQDS